MRVDRWTKTNAAAKALWASNARPLDQAQQRVVRDLDLQGIHATHVDRLLGSEHEFASVQDEAAALLQSPAVQRQITDRLSREGVKWYVIRALGYRPTLPIPPAIAKFVLNERILDIVNSYLGLCSRLIYLDVWYNLPVGDEEPAIASERWHRDGEDRHIVKLFLYLSDVDHSTGPLTYWRETQPGGRYSALLGNDLEQGIMPKTCDLEGSGDRGDVRCTGNPGSVIFFDACGLHRGGRALAKPRIVLVASYASDAALESVRYRLLPALRQAGLSAEAAYAIRSRN